MRNQYDRAGECREAPGEGKTFTSKHAFIVVPLHITDVLKKFTGCGEGKTYPPKHAFIVVTPYITDVSRKFTGQKNTTPVFTERVV